MASELFAELASMGFIVTSGDLGENVTTEGLDLTSFPLGTRLRIGDSAIVELTGLRTPCSLIDRFQKGLKRDDQEECASPVQVRSARCCKGDRSNRRRRSCGG